MITCWRYHHPKTSHVWIGWNITCHTWILLTEKFMHMISGRQISKKTTKRSCWGKYIAHSWIDACILWPMVESWAIGSVHMDLLVGVSVPYQVGWGDSYLFFLLAFLEMIVMHHLIVSSLGILVGWMVPIRIGVGHGTHTYVFAATSLWDSMLMCIKHIRNFMLGGEIWQISNFAMRIFSFRCSGMISKAWMSFHVMINLYGGF